MKPEIKFPTILGLLFLLMSTAGAIILTNSRAIFKSSAAQDCSPVVPQNTNITADSAGLFFMTEADCLVSVKIDNRTIFDARQPASGTYPATKVHFMQINNLKPATNYTYQIISGGQTFENEEYVFSTAAKPATSAPSSNLAWGKVMTPALSPATGSIIFLNIPGASLISAIVTSNGYWNIPLATSFNDKLDNWFSPPAVAADEEIIVFSTSGTITQLISGTDKNNPVPDIIIGQDYFTEDNTGNVGAGQIPTAAPGAAGTSSGTGKLIIQSPKDGENISTPRPEIFGTANPGDKISIRLSSDSTVNGETYATSNGSWTWHHTADLPPGSYGLTVTAMGTVSSAAVTQSRQFTIIPTSDSLAFTASGSGNLATPTLVPAPTLEPTSIPTIAPPPTAVPTAPRVVRPESDDNLLDSGYSLPGILLVFTAFLFISISLIFYRQSANFK